MIKVRKDVVLLIALAVIVLAGSLGMREGGVEPLDAIQCVTGVIDEKEDVDTPKIAITFDDGPHPYYTEQLLDGLKERGAKATFFVMGKQAEVYPELVLRMHEEGHLVGNHTYSQRRLQKIPQKAKENAVILLHDEYESSVTAALEIVDILQKQGYEFVTVDEILFD